MSTFPQICNHSWSCRTSILEDATFHKMSFCKFLWGNPCKAIGTFYHWGFFFWNFGVFDAFFSSWCMKELGDGFAVSFSHVYWYRDGNCNCLLLNTHRWTPIANSLQEFFVHAVLFPDSWPRRFFHNFHFWRPNSYFENLARYFFSPSFSICNNQVLFSSDKSPGHTIPIRSLISQTLVFLSCTILPIYHQVGFSSLTINSVPLWIEFLNIIISKTNSEYE